LEDTWKAEGDERECERGPGNLWGVLLVVCKASETEEQRLPTFLDGMGGEIGLWTIWQPK